MPNKFVRTNKALYIMQPWEKHTALHASQLEAGDTDLMTIRGDVVIMHCANGRASYRLKEFDKLAHIYVAELAASTFEPPPLHIPRHVN